MSKQLQTRIIKLSSAPVGFGDVADELEPHMFTTAMPVQHSHSDYEDDDIGLYVGVWDTNDMHETPGPYAMDEFMWLIEGQAVIKNCATGELETVYAGEAFVIPKGYECQWQQQGYLRKFYVISEHPDEAIPAAPTIEGIVKPHANAAQLSVDAHAFFNIAGPAPTQHQDISYRNENGKFTAGTFDSTAFKSNRQAFAANQFVYLLQGTLSISDEHGQAHIFNKGDAFFIPQGTECAWQCGDYIRFNFARLQAS